MIPAFAVEQLVANAVGSGVYGGDFHGGIWPAGSAVLHGSSPYPLADPHRLLVMMHAFITPPPLAILATPFSCFRSLPRLRCGTWFAWWRCARRCA
jgi:hypothetical protein